MGEILIGRMHSVLSGRDRRISGAEYADLEAAIFADGIAEELEIVLVAQAVTEGGTRFVTAADRRRWQAIAGEDGGAYTWATYRQALARYGLVPRTSEATIAAAQREGMTDRRATVTAIELLANGALVVTLMKNGRTWSWRPASTSSDRTTLDAAALETFLALSDFQQRLPDGPERARATQALERMGRWFRDSHSWTSFYRRHYQLGRHNADHVSALVQQRPATHPVAVGTHDFFFGDEPDDAVRAALCAVMDHIAAQYPGLYRLMQTEGFTVDTYSWRRIVHGESGWSQAPRPTGGYSPSGAPHQLNIELDPQAAAYVLVHELGHFVYRVIREQDRTVEGGSFDDHVEHAFQHLLAAAEGDGPTPFTRHYMRTGDEEWWPDAFAIALLGTSGLGFRMGLPSLLAGQSIGYDGLRQDLAGRDPLGSYWAEAVLRIFAGPMAEPAAVPMSSVMAEQLGDADEATFLERRAAVVTALRGDAISREDVESLVRLWLAHPFDRRLRAAAQGMVDRPALPADAMAILMPALARLHRHYEHDDQLVRLYALALHRSGSSWEAYQLLERFEQQWQVDMDSMQEGIVVDLVMASTTPAELRRRVLRETAPLLLQRALHLAEDAARPPRVPRVRPGQRRPPSVPTVDARTAQARQEWAALDRALPDAVIARFRTRQEWPMLQQALRALCAQVAADPAWSTACATWRRRYRL